MDGVIINNIDKNNINISLQKKKFDFLTNIDEHKIKFVIDEIFEIGYSQYIKNFIKNDLNNEIQNNTQKQINTITESKFSTLKGSIGEDLVMDIIIEKFNNMYVENTSKIPHSGDIQVRLPSGNIIIIEVKNYNKTIDQEQIDKLKFDMMFNNVRGAIFVSLNSGIVGKKKFDLEIFKHNNNDCFILFLPYSMHKIIPNKKNYISHNDVEDSIYNLSIKLEFSLCVVQNIIDKYNQYINKISKNISHTDIDFIITQFNLMYDEFKIVKNSIRKLDENIHKSIDSHKNTLNEFENSILIKINNLVGTKLCSENIYEKKIIKIKKNNTNSYDILINNSISGMIVKISDLYDVFINLNNNLISKQFDNIDSAKLFIKKL